jgi:integrase
MHGKEKSTVHKILKGGFLMNEINELARRVAQEMETAGYSPTTVWRMYADALVPLVRQHEAQGEKYLNTDIVAEYRRRIYERKKEGTISCKYSNRMLDAANKITRLNDTGKLEWSFPSRISKYKLNEYYETLLGEYISSFDIHPNTRDDVAWVARKFFAWLIENERDTLENLSADEIQRFIIHCAGYMQGSSVHNVQLYMRKLCSYLFENGIITNAYTALLSMKISRESKLYPATSQEELSLILAQIDRSTPRGKRNYAIILLGAVTGLRAVDIIRLKLSNIDWQKGDIKIVQSKTGNNLTLPLTADVGEAIKEYILYARPALEVENIFLSTHAPYAPITATDPIRDVYNNYRKKAGLPKEAFDGKSFHSLRRGLGKSMVTAGVPGEIVAQVFGSENPKSAKKYFALDSEHLKECALDFSGIMPAGVIAEGGDS